MSRSVSSCLPSVLATDLDGTFIPLHGNSDNQRDLTVIQSELVANDLSLVFVTGRHLASVQQAIQDHRLPKPHWIICDVGSSIYVTADCGAVRPVDAYADHLREIIAAYPIEQLKQKTVGIAGLRLQEEEKQGRFKLSFYADANDLPKLVAQLESFLADHAAPYSIISSIDPFNGDGLIDLLPATVSKAYALQWWARQRRLEQPEILFAGDSGNDLAALSAGYRSILVANADNDLIASVQQIHSDQDWSDRLYVATDVATSGVLAGLRHFLEA